MCGVIVSDGLYTQAWYLDPAGSPGGQDSIQVGGTQNSVILISELHS